MALGYNVKARRFYDKKTGRFVKRSRGLKSSIARKEYYEATIQPYKLAPGYEVAPLEKEYELMYGAEPVFDMEISKDIDTVEKYLEILDLEDDVKVGDSP